MCAVAVATYLHDDVGKGIETTILLEIKVKSLQLAQTHELLIKIQENLFHCCSHAKRSESVTSTRGLQLVIIENVDLKKRKLNENN